MYIVHVYYSITYMWDIYNILKTVGNHGTKKNVTRGSHHIVLPLSCLSELHTIRWKYTVAWSAQDFLAEMSQKFAAWRAS